MILGFKEYFDKKKTKPTYFREKILAQYYDAPDSEGKIQMFAHDTELGKDLFVYPKLHTIREDKHDRWETGKSIQMVYRGAKYQIKDYFNKDIPGLNSCKSVQKISIIWQKGHMYETIGSPLTRINMLIDGICYWVGFKGRDHYISWDSKYDKKIQLLIHNDGFDSIEDFFAWFKKDFSGKIIHWTDLKY